MWRYREERTEMSREEELTEDNRRLLENISRLIEESEESGRKRKNKKRLKKPQFETVMLMIVIINMAISTICWILVILKKSGLM